MIHTAEIPNKPPTIVFQKIISCTKKNDERDAAKGTI